MECRFTDASGVLQNLAHLPRWVCFLQAAAETRSTFIAQKQNHSLSPLSELTTSKREHSWILSLLRLWPAGGAKQTLSGSTFFKGKHEVLCWPQDLVTQSPFSSSFCKLFCIFSNFTMLAVSSWQRASTFNCTCDPSPDGTGCSVL